MASSPRASNLRLDSSAWPTVGLIAAGLLLFFPLVFEGKTLYLIDISYFHFPSRVFWREMIQQGQWPLWNPFICCGFPMHAEGQVSVFYPLNALLLAFAEPTAALSWYALLHFWIAAFGAYALGRSLDYSRAGSLIAALAFAFGGYMTAQLINLNIFAASAWLPVALACVAQMTQRRRPAMSLALAAALALQVLGGHPQTCVYAWLITAAFAAFEWPRARRAGGAALAWRLAWPFALAAALGAVQALPTWELKQFSPRAEALPLNRLEEYSLAPKHLLAFLCPSCLGNALFGYLGNCDYFETFAYLGTLPLLLAVVGAVKRRGGDARFWKLLAAACLVLAFGRYTPVYRLVEYAPVLNLFRAPARWLLGVTIALSLLAAAGWDAMGEGRLGRWRWLGAAGLAFGAALLLIGLGLPGNVWGARDAAYACLRALASPELLAREAPRRVAAAIAAIAAATAAGYAVWLAGSAVFLLKARWPRARWIAALAAAVVFVDLFRAGRWNVRITEPEDFYWATELVSSFSDNLGLERICPTDYGDVAGWLRENTPTVFGLYSVKGHFGQIMPRRYRRVFAHALESPKLLDLMSVRYVIEPARRADTGQILWPLLPTARRRPAAWPRAFIARRVRYAADAEDAWRLVNNPESRPGDIVLEDRRVPVSGSPGSCRITRYAAHDVRIEARARRGALVFLSDAYSPGWRAYVNGRRAPILLANYAFRACPVPPGRSRVRMVYDPASFRLGAFLTLAALGFACALACAGCISLSACAPQATHRTEAADA